MNPIGIRVPSSFGHEGFSPNVDPYPTAGGSPLSQTQYSSLCFSTPRRISPIAFFFTFAAFFTHWRLVLFLKKLHRAFDLPRSPVASVLTKGFTYRLFIRAPPRTGSRFNSNFFPAFSAGFFPARVFSGAVLTAVLCMSPSASPFKRPPFLPWSRRLSACVALFIFTPATRGSPCINLLFFLRRPFPPTRIWCFSTAWSNDYAGGQVFHFFSFPQFPSRCSLSSVC